MKEGTPLPDSNATRPRKSFSIVFRTDVSILDILNIANINDNCFYLQYPAVKKASVPAHFFMTYKADYKFPAFSDK